MGDSKNIESEPKKIREKLLSDPIDDSPPSESEISAFKNILKYYERIHGFMAGHIVSASHLLDRIIRECDLRILAFTANVVSTGIRGLIAEALRKNLFNLVITTTGTLDHDIAKSMGRRYYKGKFELDDSFLKDLNIHRLGNVLIPQENYGLVIETFVKNLFEKIHEETKPTELAPYELIWKAGSLIKDSNSIIRAAYENRIPIIVPGFYDGSFGTNTFWFSKLYGIKISVEKDQELLQERFFKENITSGALIIGGGISKHHTIWWSQFHDGLKYTIYVTTAVEYDGSLSGAHPREAISWGKLRKEGNYVVVYADATIVLPIILSKIL